MHCQKRGQHGDPELFGDSKRCPTSPESQPHRAGGSCLDEISKEYKFYLSMENALCKDWITTKFFDAMERPIVPITWGGIKQGNYSDYLQGAKAPRHSFIDARDYPNPKDLAIYLKKLMDNPSLYAEYFWWKDFYRFRHATRIERYCKLCEKLHSKIEKKTIDNFKHWWEGISQCEPCKCPC